MAARQMGSVERVQILMRMVTRERKRVDGVEMHDGNVVVVMHGIFKARGSGADISGQQLEADSFKTAIPSTTTMTSALRVHRASEVFSGQ